MAREIRTFVKETLGIGAGKRLFDAAKPKRERPTSQPDYYLGNDASLYREEVSLARSLAVMGGLVHSMAPLFINVLAEGLNNDWEAMSVGKRVAYLGKYFGAGAVDLGKWLLGPVGAGLVTAAEHVAASTTIAVRQGRRTTAA